jgi:two-component system, cell cycle sensor histidine kinase and response regulator CckA
MAIDLLRYFSLERDPMNNFVPPCASPGPVKQPRSTPTGLCDWYSGQTVLLVEDEPFVRKAIAEAIESEGYNVLIASNAAEALELQENGIEAIDLLLADVVMPKTSGPELARTVLASSPHTEILLMSGYEEQAIRCEQSLEGIAYLAKPFSIPTLLQGVRGLLGKRSRNRQEPA